MSNWVVLFVVYKCALFYVTYRRWSFLFTLSPAAGQVPYFPCAFSSYRFVQIVEFHLESDTL